MQCTSGAAVLQAGELRPRSSRGKAGSSRLYQRSGARRAILDTEGATPTRRREESLLIAAQTHCLSLAATTRPQSPPPPPPPPRQPPPPPARPTARLPQLLASKSCQTKSALSRICGRCHLVVTIRPSPQSSSCHAVREAGCPAYCYSWPPDLISTAALQAPDVDLLDKT